MSLIPPIVPPPNPVGQAKMILNGAGLAYVKPRFFTINEAQVEQEHSVEGKEDKASWLGVPIFDAFKFISPLKYTDYEGKAINISRDLIFETALVQINQEKEIRKTKVQGKSGTIKTYVSDGDYEISVTGMIVGQYANVLPEPTIRQTLDAYLRAPVPIPISCSFLDYFRVDTVVVTGFSCSQIDGVRNAFNVSIEMVSDVAYEVDYQKQKVAYAEAEFEPYTPTEQSVAMF